MPISKFYLYNFSVRNVYNTFFLQHLRWKNNATSYLYMLGVLESLKEQSYCFGQFSNRFFNELKKVLIQYFFRIDNGNYQNIFV